MANFTKTDTKRITFLSLLGSAVTTDNGDPYSLAHEWLVDMERDGFFSEGEAGSGNGPSSGRSERSGRRDSSSRSGSRGRDRARQGGNGGFTIKDPNAPATKSQVGKLLSLTEDYTWEEAEEFTKGEISQLIEDLV